MDNVAADPWSPMGVEGCCGLCLPEMGRGMFPPLLRARGGHVRCVYTVRRVGLCLVVSGQMLCALALRSDISSGREVEGISSRGRRSYRTTLATSVYH